ncbi:RNA polymerase sigma factor [Pelagovum pacificum]|uniref:RNA polymerase sigma factor n=1 Tax=Pelagovum pacificum TaxID=2588711 RepID=UPI001E2D325E|nr:RNA polymerase sigma factor [Pelagovum pacificum]
MDGAEDEDAALLAAYASGDLSAARVLMARLAPRSLTQANRMLGDRSEAEDIVQEAMVRLWRQAPDWRTGEAKVSTWLYRVVANLCTDRLRSRRRRDVSIDAVAEPESGRPSVAEDLQAEARMAALRNALADLPERQAQAVALRHLEGLSNPEIAGIMDIGIEAVESLTARGKRTLAAILAGRKDELGFTDD